MELYSSGILQAAQERTSVLNKQISQQKAGSLMELGSVLWEKVYFRKNSKKKNDKNLFLDKDFFNILKKVSVFK